MKPILVLVMFILAACATPTLMGQGVQDVSAGGFDYRVYTAPGSDLVEIHRVSFEFPPPSRTLVLAGAAEAARIATGCALREGSLAGDHALVRARVDCPP
ncbi:MAG: hypothetical protein WDA25_04705, partial [Paracoccaceae bacterium]